MSHLRIGTCSWKYDSWRGLVYSDLPALNHLAEYSRKYTTVEIDQWFWSLFPGGKILLPHPEAVREYCDAVPRDFKFSIKMPNSLTLTHYYRKDKTKELQPNPLFLSEDLFNRFLESVQPLQAHIGVLMLQFEYLNKQKMPSLQVFLDQLGEFISRVDRKHKFAVEIRNPNFLNNMYFKFLKVLKLGHVFLEGYYMPPVKTVYDKFAGELKAPVVIRLHGPDRTGMEEKSGGAWNKIIEPKGKEISQITKIIADLNSRKLEVYVNVNNHYEGSAPLTIEKITRQLEHEWGKK